MNKPEKHIVRVIESDPQKGRAVVIAKDAQHQVEWPGKPPAVGDVYTAVFSPRFAPLEKIANGNAAADIINGDTLRWRKPDASGRTRMDALQKRHLIKRAVRDYLHGENFIEIDMPLLVRGTTPDSEIESFALDGRYLVTSTEYQLNRMEIGGFDRIYTLTQNFRRGEEGRYRNPEFTMLEWARVGETLEVIERDLEQFLWRAHKALGGSGQLVCQGKKIDVTPPFDRMTVKEAVKRVTGAALPDFSAASFSKAVQAANITMHCADGADDALLFSMLMDHIQGHLGFERPVFLRDWPVFQTSSAKENESGGFVERSELIVAGVELSNGFPSITSPAHQQEAFLRQLERRRTHGKEKVELDAAYLDAMREGFPDSAAMALGFDRLVMILTDRSDIASVLAFGRDEL
ncbi:MAG: amino acid--tRNA ligase-related protein [Pseudomonadota bacterium]